MPRLLKRQDELLFLLGPYATEHAVARKRSLHLGFGFQRGGIDVAIGAFHPHLFSDAGNGAWIIAADDKHAHTLVFEIGDGFRRCWADSVPNAHEPQRQRVTLDVPLLIEALYASDEQQARIGCKPLDLQPDMFVSIAEHELRSAHDIARPFGELSSRPLLVRAEGNQARARFGEPFGILEIRDDGSRCFVGVIVGAGNGANARCASRSSVSDVSWAPEPSTGRTQATSMSPVVMVPVLSRQSTSTRANV